MVNRNNVFTIDIVKKKIPRWRTGCRAAFFVLLAMRISVFILNLFGYYLIFGVIGQRTVCFFLDAVLMILGILSIHIKYKLFYWVCSFIMGFVLIIYGTNVFAYGSDRNYIYVKSPQEQNTLIIEEDAYMFSGRCKFYQQKGIIFMKDTKAKIQMDDGYQSFQKNSLKFDWINENTVRIFGSKEGQKPDSTSLVISLK